MYEGQLGCGLGKCPCNVALQEYHQLPEEEASQVVNTAWALLALAAAGYHKKDQRALDAAARCLMNSQLPSGDWPQQHISGVFNRNCMITYANYRCAQALLCLLLLAVGSGGAA